MINEDKLIERDLKRDIWQETLDAVQSIKSGQIGAKHHINVEVTPIRSPSDKTGVIKPGSYNETTRPDSSMPIP